MDNSWVTGLIKVSQIFCVYVFYKNDRKLSFFMVAVLKCINTFILRDVLYHDFQDYTNADKIWEGQVHFLSRFLIKIQIRSFIFL